MEFSDILIPRRICLKVLATVSGHFHTKMSKALKKPITGFATSQVELQWPTTLRSCLNRSQCLAIGSQNQLTSFSWTDATGEVICRDILTKHYVPRTFGGGPKKLYVRGSWFHGRGTTHHLTNFWPNGIDLQPPPFNHFKHMWLFLFQKLRHLHLILTHQLIQLTFTHFW